MVLSFPMVMPALMLHVLIGDGDAQPDFLPVLDGRYRFPPALCIIPGIAAQATMGNHLQIKILGLPSAFGYNTPA